MTKRVKIEAVSRKDDNGQAKAIRRTSYIPAVVYGSGSANKHLKVKKLNFEKALDIAGEANLVDLVIDQAEPIKVLIKDVQKNHKGTIIHADFYKVDMNKPITINILLEFTGEAPAEKELGGTLVTSMDEVEAKCLPGDLIENIKVDLGRLKTFEDAIRVGDLEVPDTIKILDDKQYTIASVVEQHEEVEEVIEKPAEGEAEGEEAKEAGDKKGEEAKEAGGGPKEAKDKK